MKRSAAHSIVEGSAMALAIIGGLVIVFAYWMVDAVRRVAKWTQY